VRHAGLLDHGRPYLVVALAADIDGHNLSFMGETMIVSCAPTPGSQQTAEL
jgi:hypothetical protein